MESEIPRVNSFGNSESPPPKASAQELPTIEQDLDPVRKRARGVAAIADKMAKQLVERLNTVGGKHPIDDLILKIRKMEEVDLRDALLGLAAERQGQVFRRAREIIELSSNSIEAYFHYSLYYRDFSEPGEGSMDSAEPHLQTNEYEHPDEATLDNFFSAEDCLNHRVALVLSLLEEWHPEDANINLIPCNDYLREKTIIIYGLCETVSIAGTTDDGQESVTSSWHSPAADLRRLAKRLRSKKQQTYFQWVAELHKLGEHRRLAAYNKEMRLRRHLSYHDPQTFKEYIKKHGYKIVLPPASSFIKPDDLVLSPVKERQAIEADIIEAYIKAELARERKPFNVTVTRRSLIDWD